LLLLLLHWRREGGAIGEIIDVRDIITVETERESSLDSLLFSCLLSQNFAIVRTLTFCATDDGRIVFAALQ
jgi:hypothetical protein